MRYTQQCAQGCGRYTDKTARGHKTMFGHALAPIGPPHATLADRRALCGIDDVTLDGMPAMIMGAAGQFAQVATLHIGGPAIEFAWPTVARIVANGGAFKS